MSSFALSSLQANLKASMAVEITGVGKVHVMQITKHPAELCPTHEPKYRAMTVNWYEKVEPTAAKYGIKFLGSYDDHMAHTVYVLYDTPSMDVFMKFLMEPEMLAPLNFCSGRVFPVFDHKTTLALIKGAH